MFSIIIPLYNKEEYIDKAIKSVLKQSVQEFEIIIIDDGSTDNSVDKVEKINDYRIKLIKQTNGGVSMARNVGIRNAKYPYVAFLDADDLWNIDFLKTVKSLIINHPDATVFYTAHKMFKNDISKYYKNDELKDIKIDNYFNFALKHQNICTSTAVINTATLKKTNLFNENFSRGEDLLLWAELALENTFAYSPYIGAFYRRDVSTSLTRVSKPLEETFSSITEEFYQKKIKDAKYPEDFKLYMSNIIIAKAKYLIEKGKKKDAIKILKKYKTKNNKQKVIKLYLYSSQVHNPV